MFIKLSEFFIKNNTKSLYTIHKATNEKTGVYSLTYPIKEPDSEINSFFPNPTSIGLGTEAEYFHKLTTRKKTNSFGAILTSDEKVRKNSKSNFKKNSFGESFNLT